MYLRYIIEAISRYIIKFDFDILIDWLVDKKYIEKKLYFLTSKLSKKF